VGVADAAGQVAIAGDHAQTRDVDEGFLELAAVGGDDFLKDLLGVGMMNEAGLQRRNDLDVFLDRIEYWAFFGSMLPNAFSIMSRAWVMSLVIAGLGEKTKSWPA